MLVCLIILIAIILFLLWLHFRRTGPVINIEDIVAQRTQEILATCESRVAQLRLEHSRNVEDARRQSVAMSRSGINAGVWENFTPLLAGYPYSHAESWHIGGLFDFIVYDGLEEGDIRDVIFVEVKTGSARLSARQKKVKDAVEAGRVKWVTWRPDKAVVAQDRAPRPELLPGGSES